MPTETTTAVRLGIIGCGRIAQVAHLPAIEKADGVAAVAVCDPSLAVATQLAARFGITTALTDTAELLARDDIDAVVITAPDRFHFPLAMQALQAGKHVLVEKPLTSTSAEGVELAALVEGSGLVLQVGAMKRHDPGLQWAHAFTQHSLGELRSFTAWYRIGDLRAGIEATLFPPAIVDPEAKAHEATFKADRRRYLLATHGAHIFDTVRMLCGDIGSVVARHREDGRDNAWQVVMTTRSGAVGTIAITVDVPGVPSEGIECFGSRGALRVDVPFPFYRLSSKVAAYVDGAVTTPVLTDGDAYERQVEAFAHAIRTGEAPTPNVHDGLAAVQLIEAVAAAVDSGLEVCL